MPYIAFPVGGPSGIGRGFWYASRGYYLGRHYAVDLEASYWTPIKAELDGRISAKGYDSLSGYYVYLDATPGDGLVLRFCHRHMYRPSELAVGTRVRQGQVIGYVGSTGDSLGPHLHLDMWTSRPIRDNDSVYKPKVRMYAVNPALYLGKEAILTRAEVVAVIKAEGASLSDDHIREVAGSMLASIGRPKGSFARVLELASETQYKELYGAFKQLNARLLRAAGVIK